MAAITVLLLLVLILGFSSAMPLGAPAGACENLLPSPGPHGPGSNVTNPYTLTIDGLLNSRGYYFYQPGYTYNVTLRGSGNVTTFRGFLVQLRSAADQSILPDQLAENSDDIQQHMCMPPSGGFTHNNRTDKNYITFQWTPRAGTGTVVFRYSVVRTLMMHWDALSTPMLYENLPRCSNTSTVDRATVYYTARNASISVSFRLPGMNENYAALGFSRDRIMPQTDIVVGGIGQAGSFVDDRFATIRAMPPVDATQNLMSTSVVLTNGSIQVNFTRPLYTGDSQDFNLSDSNCFYLLVASGPVADINARTIGVHTYRMPSTYRYCFSDICSPPPPPSGAGMITGLSVWLLLMIAAVQYLL